MLNHEFEERTDKICLDNGFEIIKKETKRLRYQSQYGNYAESHIYRYDPFYPLYEISTRDGDTEDLTLGFRMDNNKGDKRNPFQYKCDYLEYRRVLKKTMAQVGREIFVNECNADFLSDYNKEDAKIRGKVKKLFESYGWKYEVSGDKIKLRKRSKINPYLKYIVSIDSKNFRSGLIKAARELNIKALIEKQKTFEQAGIKYPRMIDVEGFYKELEEDFRFLLYSLCPEMTKLPEIDTTPVFTENIVYDTNDFWNANTLGYSDLNWIKSEAKEKEIIFSHLPYNIGDQYTIVSSSEYGFFAIAVFGSWFCSEKDNVKYLSEYLKELKRESLNYKSVVFDLCFDGEDELGEVGKEAVLNNYVNTLNELGREIEKRCK